MKLYCVRHGESEYNVRGLCNADPGISVKLTPAGIVQAKRVAEKLSGVPIERVYTSELERAIDTARLITEGRSLPFQADPRLNDRNSGFEGQPVSEYLDAAYDDPLNFRGPEGETYLEQKARVFSFIEDLLETDADHVLIVSHHEVLQIITGYFEDLSDLEMWRYWIGQGELLTFETESTDS